MADVEHGNGGSVIGAVKQEKVEYGGWPNCVRLTNGIVDVVVTTDIGPRIIRFGFVGERNQFKEYDEQLGQTGGDKWRIYGGHRLWHAPEDEFRTYFPDNHPVQVEQMDESDADGTGGGVRFVQQVEPTTGLQKEIEVRLDARQARVTVTHRLRNRHVWAIETAPWALSVMAQGGQCIIPLPPRGSHPEALLPASTLTLWAFTDMADARWTWGSKYILLRQNPDVALPQKVGASVPDGWIAYANAGDVFLVQFDFQRGATYPDMGCCVETFTNDEMLEVETLGPTVSIAPGASVEHVEHWSLFGDVPMPGNDADVDARVLPLVSRF